MLRSHFQFAFYLEVVVLTARYLILKEIASSVLYRVDRRFCPAKCGDAENQTFALPVNKNGRTSAFWTFVNL